MTRYTTRRDLLRGLGTTALVGTALPLAGCSAPSDGDGSSGGADGSPSATVEMTDELTYEPETVEIEAGGTVTWENVGTIGHTVTAYDDELPDGATYFASGGFESETAARDGYPNGGNVPEGESYEHTFETPGEYGYFCIPHELNGMVGTVRVS